MIQIDRAVRQEDDVDQDAEAAEVLELDLPVVEAVADLRGSASRCSDHLFSRYMNMNQIAKTDRGLRSRRSGCSAWGA